MVNGGECCSLMHLHWDPTQPTCGAACPGPCNKVINGYWRLSGLLASCASLSGLCALARSSVHARLAIQHSSCCQLCCQLCCKLSLLRRCCAGPHPEAVHRHRQLCPPLSDLPDRGDGRERGPGACQIHGPCQLLRVQCCQLHKPALCQSSSRNRGGLDGPLFCRFSLALLGSCAAMAAMPCESDWVECSLSRRTDQLPVSCGMKAWQPV